MNTAIEINNDVWWVGVNDRRTHLFENHLPLPNGVAYNAYVVKDRKIALMDTVEQSFWNDYIGNVEAICEGRNPDYLVINHMEPDHTGAVLALTTRYPDITILGNVKTINILSHYYNAQAPCVTVGDGEVFSLGRKHLIFGLTPMVHWPETMVTYLPELQLLFSGDVFGSFGTLDGGVFDDEVEMARMEGEISRYYSNIVGKYALSVQKALQKLEGLEIDIICPAHGVVWRNRIKQILELYDRWSRYDADCGATIVFGSMYGHTEKIADTLARHLRKAGVPSVRIHDVSKVHPSYIIDDIFRLNGVVLGCPAYNGGIFPPMGDLLSRLLHIGVKNRKVTLFANKTWGGGAIREMLHFVDTIGWNLVAEPWEVCGEPTRQDAEICRTQADSFAKQLLRT